MKNRSRILISALAAFVAAPLLPAKEVPLIPITQTPAVEVCFVLDTTGSMGGLIAGAKRKIWSIANETVTYKPKEIRFGLIGYRDRGDQYVTKKTELTNDLDAVHTALNSFTAAGGGDGPESVNQALKEAVSDLNWSSDPKVRKLIFLVGDAPPHMDYANETQYPETCKLAKKKGIRINTILCGLDGNTANIWKQIADQGAGQYAAIPQKGGAVAITTPYDDKINGLSVSLNGTIGCWGSHSQQLSVNSKVGAINKASKEAQATRASYATNNFKGKVITGHGDLVNDWAEGKVKLSEIKPEQLGGDLKGLTGEALEAKLKEKQTERTKLQKELSELVKKRESFITEKKKEQKKDVKKDSFDAQVTEMLKNQLSVLKK